MVDQQDMNRVGSSDQGTAGDTTVADAVLFSSSACHLCEQALDLLSPWLSAGLKLRVDDISESDELFERYGLSIPVLRHVDSGVELNWPFDQRDIAKFLADQGLLNR